MDIRRGCLLLHCIVARAASHNEVARYACHRAWLDKGQPRCISFGGTRVDAAVAIDVLRVVQPVAIEAAIVAHREEASKQDEVRGELERRWNQALQNVGAIERRLEQLSDTKKSQEVPSVEEFTELAERLEALWQSEDTDARLKKRIVRALIQLPALLQKGERNVPSQWQPPAPTGARSVQGWRSFRRPEVGEFGRPPGARESSRTHRQHRHRTLTPAR